jgi:hypothetical protein
MTGPALDETPEFMTLEALVDYTGISEVPWLVLRSLDIGPNTFKVGAHRMWRRSSLDAWRADEARRQADEATAHARLVRTFGEIRKAWPEDPA